MSAKDENENEIDRLVALASDGDTDALASLFAQHKSQLRRMVSFRLDENLKGRVDPSDVLQEAFLDLADRLPEFKRKSMSFYVWLRLVTKERLLRIHRENLDAKMRDARREVRVRQRTTGGTSIALAAHLLGKYTSVCGNAIRAEQSVRLHDVLNEMDEADREIITLRLFEDLTNGETAEVLGLTKHASSKRFVRAVTRIRKELKELPGFI